MMQNIIHPTAKYSILMIANQLHQKNKVPERQKNTILRRGNMVFFFAILAIRPVPGHFFLKGKALLEEFSLLL